MRRLFQFFLPLVCVLGLHGTLAAAGEREFGPLLHDFKLTLDAGDRTEAFGPFYYSQRITNDNSLTRSWAVPPLFSYTVNEDVDYEWFDFLWKGITYSRYGSVYRWQMLQWVSFAGGDTQTTTNIDRFTLFPLYFQQRTPDPELNYTALVPFYGTLRGRLFRDEVKFIALPLYLQTRKKDIVTDNYLFPFFHVRRGDSLRGWQFWPLYGSEHRDAIERTNHWGDTFTLGGHDKRFVLWPFFLQQHTGIGTTNDARLTAVIPFYAQLRSPMRDSTWWGWPLGVVHTEDRLRKFSEWGAPWPFIVFARGEGKHVNRVWPLFSQARNESQAAGWYLWPLYKYNRLHSDTMERERRRVLFFLYSDTTVKNRASGERQRQTDLWPLFTARTELDGRRRLQILAPLEPFLPNNTSVQRDLAPLWSVWRAEENPKTGEKSRSLLWNLYRWEETIPHSALPAPGSKKCSLLFGAIQYQTGTKAPRWRVVGIPFGKGRAATETPAH